MSSEGRKVFDRAQTIDQSTHQRYKAVVRYDGTDYNGWQTQRAQAVNAGSRALLPTIQDKLERRLSNVLCGANVGVAIAGSGRTDAGVHAAGQVFHFEAPKTLELRQGKKKGAKESLQIDSEKLMQFLRNGLPPSIQVVSVEPTTVDFHARESCIKKRYIYTVCEGVASPFETRFCHSIGHEKQLNVDDMNAAALLLVGEHDFSAFGVIEEGDPRTPIKRMERLCVKRHTTLMGSSMVTITAECDRFLWHMMRMISGTLIEVGLGKLSPEDVNTLLNTGIRAGDLHKAGIRVKTAPACGLCLDRVFY